LRTGEANLFEGLDEYADLVDPVTSTELTTGSLSTDITVCAGALSHAVCRSNVSTGVAGALSHGLRLYDQGRTSEALWWCQFSYLSDWGERAASALRVLQSLLGHILLDADEETISEAEFDALHP